MSIERREKYFFVKAQPALDADYADEVALEISHNGYQSAFTSLSKSEAIKVIKALSEWFKLDEVKN